MRLAVSDDAARLDALFPRVFGAEWATEIGATVIELLNSPDHQIFLYCLDDDVVIGWAALSYGFLHGLGVLAEYRQADRGYELLKVVVEGQWPNKPAVFHSIHDDRVKGAGNRFRRLGFEEIPGRIREHYYVMRRAVAPEDMIDDPPRIDSGQ